MRFASGTPRLALPTSSLLSLAFVVLPAKSLRIMDLRKVQIFANRRFRDRNANRFPYPALQAFPPRPGIVESLHRLTPSKLSRTLPSFPAQSREKHPKHQYLSLSICITTSPLVPLVSVSSSVSILVSLLVSNLLLL